MNTMSLLKECISGVTHTGIPKGSIIKFADADVYVAIPPEGVEYDKSKAVLFFTGTLSTSFMFACSVNSIRN